MKDKGGYVMPWGKPEKSGVTCSLVQKRTAYLELVPRAKIELLMGKYGSREWLAYLVGHDGEDLFIEDISVPPHKYAGGGAAEAEPFHQPENCIGVIHSHHTMGAFHSGTDDAHVDRNYALSITVAARGNALEYDAVSYQKTPCGKAVLQKCAIMVVRPDSPFDEKEFLKTASKNIEKGGIVVHRIQSKPIGYTDNKGNVLSPVELSKMLDEIYNLPA